MVAVNKNHERLDVWARIRRSRNPNNTIFFSEAFHWDAKADDAPGGHTKKRVALMQ